MTASASESDDTTTAPSLASDHELPEMKVFYGPPGTGKTYAAAREAVAIIDGRHSAEELGRSGNLVARYNSLIASGQIWPVAFHPTYSYEDFVEGLRPKPDDSSDLRFQVEDGPFKRACRSCLWQTSRQVSNGEVLAEGRGRWKIERVTEETVTILPLTTGAGQQRKIVAWEVVDSIVEAIVAGRVSLDALKPVKGRDIAKQQRAALSEAINISSWQLSDEGLLRALVKRELPRREAEIPNWIRAGDRVGSYLVTFVDAGGAVLQSTKERADRVVMSPEQYVSFWLLRRLQENGIKPSELSHPGKAHDAMNLLGNRIQISPQYVRMFGPVRALYQVWLKRSLTASGLRKVVLVLEEMNRADLARVFGDMLTLVEIDKRIGMAEERRLTLPYSRRSFGVPKTLSIVGTMNTTDRSVFEVDHAFRRRFRFIEMSTDYSILRDALTRNGIAEDLQEAIVAACKSAGSKDYQIGHSYFMGVSSAAEALDVWVQQIKPAIEQHYWSDSGNIARIVGHFKSLEKFLAGNSEVP